MSIYDLYETDPSLEKEGVWIDTISEPEQFLVASTDTPAFKQTLSEFYRPRINEIRQAEKLVQRGKKMPQKVDDFLKDGELRAFCKHCLLGWKNVKDRKGKDIPYSPEAAYDLLSQPTLRKLKEALFAEAEKVTNFMGQTQEDAEKNSKKTSSGTSAGGQ